MIYGTWLNDEGILTPLKVYRVPILPNCDTLEIVGAVRKISNSYEWWRWESRFFPEWKAGHGFEANEWEAMVEVSEGGE